MSKLTIFTPAYNRAGMLRRLYESLTQQTNKDFEWLIVDDGSEDSTKELINELSKESAFPIHYMWQKNGGKMRAHNAGVQLANTELFVCLDSDDHFTKTAVDDILKTWEKYGDDDKLAGIIAYKGESEEAVLYGSTFPDTERSTLRGLYLMGFKGETTLVFRTGVIREFLFPDIPGEKYVPEDYTYDQIDEEYDYYVLPKILTVCELVSEGYTDRVEQLRRENPTAWYLYYEQRARLKSSLTLKIKYISHYLRFRKLARKDYRKRHQLPFYMEILGIPGAVILSIKGKL
ncbi:MAG: glycosyltransferase family 2 protein [Lachnospiraceae bacterium]|nr:glycosyltransferase family 2 protein [Lachnospiraceae bacterium]